MQSNVRRTHMLFRDAAILRWWKHNRSWLLINWHRRNWRRWTSIHCNWSHFPRSDAAQPVFLLPLLFKQALSAYCKTSRTSYVNAIHFVFISAKGQPQLHQSRIREQTNKTQTRISRQWWTFLPSRATPKLEKCIPAEKQGKRLFVMEGHRLHKDRGQTEESDENKGNHYSWRDITTTHRKPMNRWKGSAIKKAQSSAEKR